MPKPASGSRSRVLSAAASIALLVSVIAAAPVGAATPQMAYPSEAQLVVAIENFLADRASHITGQAAKTQGGLAVGKGFEAEAKARLAVLDGRRETIKKLLIEYVDPEIEVTLGDITRAGETLTVPATERTKLHFRKVKGDEPEFTGYREEHVFTFAIENGQWVLSGQEPLALDSLAPITEAVMPADATTDPTAADPAAASIDRPKGKLQDDPKDLSASSGSGAITPMAIPVGLDYAAMVTYARKYWTDYNPTYRDFSANGGGGDCTNFISQILRHGGWKFAQWADGDRTNPNQWWYGLINQTYTWAGAENWSWFAPQRTVHLSNVWDMSKTDVLQYDGDRNGTMDHTMIVTKKTTTEIYMTYHTSDHLDRPLSEIIAGHSGAWWYSYRT